MKEWIKAILILPVNALIIIPLIFLYFGGYKFSLPATFFVAIGLVLFLLGVGFMAWTITLFHKYGRGTVAPWSPPRRLVVRGPYCYSRNPMLSGALAVLLGESIMLGSVQILVWTVIFFLINMIFFILHEEKSLERRFGVDYSLYKRAVPRWIPRLSKWELPNDPTRKK